MSSVRIKVFQIAFLLAALSINMRAQASNSCEQGAEFIAVVDYGNLERLPIAIDRSIYCPHVDLKYWRTDESLDCRMGSSELQKRLIDKYCEYDVESSAPSTVDVSGTVKIDSNSKVNWDVIEIVHNF